MAKNNEVKRSIEIFLDSGLKIVLNYKIEEMNDDYIQEEFQEYWENKKFWFPEGSYEVDLLLDGDNLDMLDMRRVIACKFN